MTGNRTTSAKPRRLLAYESFLGTTHLHLHNPYIAAFWSAMFPGFGHLLLSRYLQAYILIIWEIVINFLSHVNLAMLYSMLGDAESAKTVIDIRWSLLYVPTYVFAIWDSYRSAVDLNKHYILASREDAPLTPFVSGELGINYFDKRSPFMTSLWSAATPGLGQVMLQRFMHGIFILAWWIVIVYFSNVLTAINLTLTGEIAKGREALDPQWFMNIPSVFFFCIYSTYVNAVENNKLFNREQSQYLKRNYQNSDLLLLEKSGEN